MSNPLFASHMMQMAYLCKNKKQPGVLLGLFTLGDGVYTDKSRYGGLSVIPSTTSVSSTYSYPFLDCPWYTTLSFTLGKSIDLGKDWTLEYMRVCPSHRPHSYISLGPLKFQNDHGDDGVARVYLDETQLTSFDGWRGTGGALMQNAITYNSSTQTLTMYANSAQLATCVQGLTGRIAGNITVYAGGISYGSQAEHYFFSNIRLVQKLITPVVPSGLYTGYESL